VTIINATRQGDRAHIITDAAWTDNATGCLTHIASKYIVGNAFPFIIAPTGNPNPFSLNAAIEAERPRNGRQLLEVLPKILRQMDAESKIPLDAGFVIATWDKRAGRPMLHLIANTETHWPGVMPPFELYWIEHVIGGEVPVDEALGREVDMADRRSFDPMIDGAELVEVQRRHHDCAHTGVTACRLGGAVEVATLTRRGVRIDRVREWPDRIGELIVPGVVEHA